MVYMREVHCKYCGKKIGYYAEGDEGTYRILMKSKQEHEMHWCPKRHLKKKKKKTREEMYDIKEFSKDERAKELCGLRPRGNPVFLPHELGYACPLCGNSDEVNLHFSEYEMFLWCKKCNRDIPSCLCIKYPEPNLDYTELPPDLKIERATKIFLDCIEEAKKK